VIFLFAFNRADFDFVPYYWANFDFMRKWAADRQNKKNTSADGESDNYARTFLWDIFKY